MKKTALALLALICGTGVVLADSTEIVSLDEANEVIEALDSRISANGQTITFRPGNGAASQIFARIRHPSPARTVMVTENYLGTGGVDFPPFYSLETGQVALSANGRFAVFTSNGCDITANHKCVNIDPAPGRALFNVYRRDLYLGVTRLVSQSINDDSGNHVESYGDSTDPLVSADGRWVAFESFATDLYDFPSHPGYRDVYIRDLDAEIVESLLLSAYRAQDCLGQEPGHSWLGDMTPDGRFVVFVSSAPQLRNCDPPPPELVEAYELFIWDRQNPFVIERPGILVSDPHLAENFLVLGGPYRFHPSISDDGRYIAFVDSFINVYDSDTKSTLFPLSPPGFIEPNAYSPQISGNGKKVAFQSSQSLVAEDTNELEDIYVLDVITAEIELASRPPSGAGNGYSYIDYPAGFFKERPGSKISTDGRYIAFHSYASNMVPFDTNNNIDTFVRDVQLGETRLASETPSGEAAVAANIELDATGTLAVFQALSYVPDNPNSVTVVLRDMRQPTDLIADLKQDIVALNLRNGVSNSLDGKLIAVDQALSDTRNNNDVAAIAALEAFILTVEAQRGINLTDEEADQLVAVAQTIINLI